MAVSSSSSETAVELGPTEQAADDVGVFRGDNDARIAIAVARRGDARRSAMEIEDVVDQKSTTGTNGISTADGGRVGDGVGVGVGGGGVAGFELGSVVEPGCRSASGGSRRRSRAVQLAQRAATAVAVAAAAGAAGLLNEGKEADDRDQRNDDRCDEQSPVSRHLVSPRHALNGRHHEAFWRTRPDSNRRSPA